MEIEEVKKQEQKDNIMNTKRIFMLPHNLTNFEIQKYYQSDPRFNGVYLEII